MKEKIIKKLKELSKIFKEFPITFITSILISLVITFLDNLDISEDILNFLLIFIVGTILTESLNKLIKKYKYGYIISFILSIIFTYLINKEYIWENNILIRLFIFYILASLIVIILVNYKTSKKDLSNYLLSIFSSIFKSSLIYLILIIGISIIIALFESLILKDVNFDHIAKGYILILGFYYLPTIVYSLRHNDDISDFIKLLVTKILYILMLITNTIIYIYIIKIIITNDMPSNTLFPILTILFACSIILSIMVKNTEKNKTLIKINNILHLLLIPFIALQIYALGIRIFEYGLTITRYIGIIIILVELSYILIEYLKKKDEYIFYSILTALTISLLIPFINAYKLPISYQRNVLYNNINSNIEKAFYAYDYLEEYDLNISDVKKKLTEEQINKLNEYEEKNTNNYYYNNTKYYSSHIDNDSIIDIEGYKTIKQFTYDSDEDDDIDTKILEKLNYLISNYENEYDDDNKFLSENNIVKYNDKKIIITNYNITTTKDKITSYYIIGYILTK